MAEEVIRKIEETGIDFGHMTDYAVKIAVKHGDRGIEVLKRFTEKNHPFSISDLYFELERQSIEKIIDFFDKFGSENFKYAHSVFSVIDQYDSTRVKKFLEEFGIQNSSYLNSFLDAQDKFGEDVTNKIAREYGMKFVKLVSPYYQNDRDLVSRIFERFGKSNSFLLEGAFPIYRKYEQAKEEGGDIGQYDVRFEGYVQDVGFRGTASTYAEICELKGTVRNMDDGSVNAIVQGTRPLVKCFRSSLDDYFKSSSKIIKQEMGEPFQSFEIQ